MSTFWEPGRILSYEVPSTWPATVDLQLRLRPSDFFGKRTPGDELVTVVGESSLHIDGVTGKIELKDSGNLPSPSIMIAIEGGRISINDNIANLQAVVGSPEDLERVILDAEISLSVFLSIQIGVFAEVSSIEGTINGKRLVALWQAGTYSAHFAQGEVETRDTLIKAGFNVPHPDNPSFARFLAAAKYFHHATRFLSPLDVKYIPHRAYPEIVLNLSKCLDTLAPSRDKLRQLMLKLGYTHKQIESQIVPIGLVRNEFDVGHCVVTKPTQNDLILLRRFVDRAIQNIAAILRRTSQHIAVHPSLLQSVDNAPSKKRERLAESLREHLDSPSLSEFGDRPLTITGM